MNAKLLASVLGLLLVAVVAESRTVCPVNSVPVECVPCNQYCNEEPIFCTAVCTPGRNLCACRPGYIRLSRTNNMCVHESNCPRTPRCPLQ